MRSNTEIGLLLLLDLPSDDDDKSIGQYLDSVSETDRRYLEAREMSETVLRQRSRTSSRNTY